MLATGATLMLWLCPHQTTVYEHDKTLAIRINIAATAMHTIGPAAWYTGSCGAGPNVALLPQGMLLHHVSTPADLAEVLSSQCGLSISQELLKATEVRMPGYMRAGHAPMPFCCIQFQSVPACLCA